MFIYHQGKYFKIVESKVDIPPVENSPTGFDEFERSRAERRLAFRQFQQGLIQRYKRSQMRRTLAIHAQRSLIRRRIKIFRRFRFSFRRRHATLQTWPIVRIPAAQQLFERHRRQTRWRSLAQEISREHTFIALRKFPQRVLQRRKKIRLWRTGVFRRLVWYVNRFGPHLRHNVLTDLRMMRSNMQMRLATSLYYLFLLSKRRPLLRFKRIRNKLMLMRRTASGMRNFSRSRRFYIRVRARHKKQLTQIFFIYRKNNIFVVVHVNGRIVFKTSAGDALRGISLTGEVHKVKGPHDREVKKLKRSRVAQLLVWQQLRRFLRVKGLAGPVEILIRSRLGFWRHRMMYREGFRWLQAFLYRQRVSYRRLYLKYKRVHRMLRTFLRLLNLKIHLMTQFETDPFLNKNRHLLVRFFYKTKSNSVSGSDSRIRRYWVKQCRYYLRGLHRRFRREKARKSFQIRWLRLETPVAHGYGVRGMKKRRV